MVSANMTSHWRSVLVTVLVILGLAWIYRIMDFTPVPSAGLVAISNNKSPRQVPEHPLLASLKAECTANMDLTCHVVKTLTGCGEICDTTMLGVPQQGSPFNFTAKQVNCDALWGNVAIDAGRDGKPPRWDALPRIIRDEFKMQGRVAITMYDSNVPRDQKLLGNPQPLHWGTDELDRSIAACATGNLEGTYMKRETRNAYALLQKMPSVRGGHVLVIGSQNPWLEACALAAGAKHVTTLEYREIISSDPRVSTLTPDAARKAFLDGSLPKFDAVATWSSVEHSGLSRYGDMINPWGDLQTLARAWCVVRPDGDVLVGVPTLMEKERIEWNCHRMYGPVRWPHLLANWEAYAHDEIELPGYQNHAFIARRKNEPA